MFNTSLTPSSFITICIGIIVAANGCNAIIIASNTIYNMENSSIIRRYTKSLILMIIIIILFAFILVVPLFGRTIANFLIKYIFSGYKSIVNTIYLVLQLPVSLFIMYYIIKLIYVIAPDERIRSKYVSTGAAFTTISWLIVTVCSSYYINNVARYDLVYGNLANIVILLFWFYILAYIFVIGLCINKDSVEQGIEKTNKIKLEEIRKKIKEEKK
jgi:membrane protein